jgi:S1-C subfamily serine protease
MQIRVALLLPLSILGACASNPPISSLSAEQREKVTQIVFLKSGDIPKDSYSVLGTVEGLACKRNAYASGTPSFEEAKQGVSIRAAQLGADAVMSVLCEENHKVDWGNNCWQSVVCIGDAIAVSDPSVLARLRPREDGKVPGAVSTGTGWVVEPGYIVTNHHVVEGASDISALLSDGRKVTLAIVADDPINDLAVLTLAGGGALPSALSLSRSDAQIGAGVFTVGYPHTDILGSNAKVTNGIISANSGLRDDPRLYQITVPLQSGNSGGPLVTMDGRVVGVTTSKLDAVRVFQYTGDLPQGINYAVKSHYVAALIASTGGLNRSDAPPLRARVPFESLQEAVAAIQGSVVQVVAK